MVLVASAVKPPTRSPIRASAGSNHCDHLDSQYAKCCFNYLPILTGGKIACYGSIILYIAIALWLSINYNWLWMITLLYALISPVLIAIGLQKKSYLFFSLPIMMDLLEIFFATLFLLVTCLLGVAGYEDSKHLEQYAMTTKAWHSVGFGWLVIFVYYLFSIWKVTIHYRCYQHLKNPPMAVPTIYA